MKVPLFDVDLGEEEENAVLDTLRSRWLSTGPRTAAFEEAFAKAVGAQHAIAVIKDPCHGLLSTLNGRKLGTIGRVGCFSFFPNKNMTTAEGGMIVTDDAEIARRVRLLRSHAMTTVSYDRARGHASSYDV